jgi:hypothetical protein
MCPKCNNDDIDIKYTSIDNHMNSSGDVYHACLACGYVWYGTQNNYIIKEKYYESINR